MTGWLIPGWFCGSPKCGLFNGEVKEPRALCRGCDSPKPMTPEEKRNRAMLTMYRSGPKTTIVEVARKFKMSRSRAGSILKSMKDAESK